MANWALARVRSSRDLATLESWLENDADVSELSAFLAGCRSIHSTVFARASHPASVKGSPSKGMASALAAEQQSLHAVALFVEAQLGESAVEHWRETFSRLDCPRVASGSVAAIWACQVALAAATERAMLRLGLRRELLALKQRHSACSARCLLEWSKSDHANLTTDLTFGFDRVVERYSALLANTVGTLQHCA